MQSGWRLKQLAYIIAEEDGRVAGEIEGKKVGKQTEKGGRDSGDTLEEYQNNPAANPARFLLFFKSTCLI